MLQSARNSFEALAAEDKASARDLALVLLSLGHNQKPLGSRELKPTLIDRVAGERIWEREDWIVLYKIEKKKREVLIARFDRAG